MKTRRSKLMLAFYGLLLAAAALFVGLQSGVGAASAGPDQPGAVAAVPSTINYGGILRNPDGSLLANGTYNITAKIYSVESGGTALYTETFANTTVQDGLFNIVLGDNPPGPNALRDALTTGPRWLGITVGSAAELSPRQRVHSVPWALVADSATNATNADHATNADNATNATHATTADNSTWSVASAQAYVKRDIGDSNGGVTSGDYYRDLQRYVVEAKDAASQPDSVPVDDAVLQAMCADADGCMMTLAMRDWATPLCPGCAGGALADTAYQHFSMSAISGGKRQYRINWLGGAVEAVDGDNAQTNVMNTFNACYLTDYRHVNGAAVLDTETSFFVLNLWGAYDSTDMVCVLTIED